MLWLSHSVILCELRVSVVYQDHGDTRGHEETRRTSRQPIAIGSGQVVRSETPDFILAGVNFN